jgi:excisionase family DNA binding protein
MPSQREQPPALTDELFTVSEVAAILKLSEQTIRNWIDAGALPALRLGTRVRIKRAVLQQILEHGL